MSMCFGLDRLLLYLNCVLGGGGGCWWEGDMDMSVDAWAPVEIFVKGASPKKAYTMDQKVAKCSKKAPTW